MFDPSTLSVEQLIETNKRLNRRNQELEHKIKKLQEEKEELAFWKRHLEWAKHSLQQTHDRTLDIYSSLPKVSNRHVENARYLKFMIKFSPIYWLHVWFFN